MEVRGPHLKNNYKKSKCNNMSTTFIFYICSVTSFYPVSVCPSQGGVCVCQVSVCVRTAGQEIAVVVSSPQQPVNQPTACFAAGEGDVCVVSVCVMTPNTLETSVRGALRAKAAANQTGTCQFLFATTKHDGSAYRLFVVQPDINAISHSFSFRQCVECHLAHGLTQKEAGHCNNTCAPLVGYMDDVSGTAISANSIWTILHLAYI